MAVTYKLNDDFELSNRLMKYTKLRHIFTTNQHELQRHRN